MPSKPNYKLRLKNALNKIHVYSVLISTTKPLCSSEERNMIGISKGIDRALKIAFKCLNTGETDKAYSILCDIPYFLSGPYKGATKTEYVGTRKAYKEFDKIRHCIRMLDLESGNEIDSSSKWKNSLMILG